MYGPPRRCKDLWSILTIDSLRKCIRPLASGLLLQPGHDEICARRFHKACSGTKPAFSEGFTACRSTVSSSLLEPRNLLRDASAEDRIDPLVERPRTVYDTPRFGRFCSQSHDNLIDVHPPLQAIEPNAEAIPCRSRCKTHDRAP